MTCPLTKLSYSGDTLVTSNEAKYGEPLVDVQMSQGSFPCIHHRTSHNAYSKDHAGQSKKLFYPLFPEDYYKPCEEIEFGNVTISEAKHIFEKVDGFKGVSEKQLLLDNRKAYDYADIFKSWVSFLSKNKMDTYVYDMYSKHYLEWHECPLKFSNDKEDNDFTARELMTAFEKAEAISGNASWFYGLTQANFCIIFIELFVILAHVNEALNHKVYTILISARRLLSIFFIGFGIYNLSSIRAWNSHGTLEAISTDAYPKCHQDKALDATFDTMRTYVHSIQSGGSQFFLIIFLMSIIAAMLLTTFVKFVQCDKILKNPDVDDNYTEIKDKDEKQD